MTKINGYKILEHKPSGNILPFIIALLVFIASIAVFIYDYTAYTDYIPVKATIIDFDKETRRTGTPGNTERHIICYATYEYEVNGETYTCRLEVADLVNRIGDVDTVKYNPEHPSQLKEKTISAFALCFGVISGFIVFVNIKSMTGRKQGKVFDVTDKNGDVYTIHK